MRPFRFSVMASSAADGATWSALARRAEDLGYDALMVPDHLGRQLAPITALAAAAAATTRLRIAPFVFANDFRHRLIGLLASGRNAALAGAAALTGTPYVLHGTPGRVRDILLRRRESWGLNSYTFVAGSMESMAPIVEALAGR